jgi:hypothetical protein
MHRASLFLARTAVTAWVGAAVLFVIVGVSEVVHSGFGSEIRDQLVVLRFPWYYRCGVTLLALGLIGTLGARNELPGRRRGIAAALIGTALVVMIAEYFAVYLPLAALVTPPGKPRTPEFMTYHKLSMWVNFAGLALSFVAAALLNWPAKPQANDHVNH